MVSFHADTHIISMMDSETSNDAVMEKLMTQTDSNVVTMAAPMLLATAQTCKIHGIKMSSTWLPILKDPVHLSRTKTIE